MKHKLDHVSGATTLLDRNYLHTPTRRPPPPHVTRFLARNGIGLPQSGEFIPISKIDQALDGWSIGDRIQVKHDLRFFNLIAP